MIPIRSTEWYNRRRSWKEDAMQHLKATQVKCTLNAAIAVHILDKHVGTRRIGVSWVNRLASVSCTQPSAGNRCRRWRNKRPENHAHSLHDNYERAIADLAPEHQAFQTMSPGKESFAEFLKEEPLLFMNANSFPKSRCAKSDRLDPQEPSRQRTLRCL